MKNWELKIKEIERQHMGPLGRQREDEVNENQQNFNSDPPNTQKNVIHKACQS